MTDETDQKWSMWRRVLPSIIIALSFLIYDQKAVIAQQTQSKCSLVRYSDPDSKVREYQLMQLEGQAVYASPEQKWEQGPAGGVCVVIFDKSNKSQVGMVITDDKGQFEFANIKPGAYTLVASAGDLQVISIAVRIGSEGKDKSKRLLLHLREKEDKRKTYVTMVARADLRSELLHMVQEDQKIRNEMIKKGAAQPSEDMRARIDAIDQRNTLRMKTIIKEHGWPGASLVGWDGSDAAFVIVQHSDHQTQKELLPLLQKEFRKGNLSGPNYALFTDRVLAESGKPQIYGSRARPIAEWKAGEPVFYPIEDENNVDKRREEVGLSTMADYRKFLKEMYKPK